MISMDQVDALTGHTVVGINGEKIGKVGAIYLDDVSGQPEWVTVSTGLFGTAESFVPLSDATVTGTDLQVNFDKDVIKGAPRVGADGHLSPTEEDDLYRYYGHGESTAASGGVNTSGMRFEGAGRDTTDTTDTTDATLRTDRTERSDRTDRAGEAGVVGHDTSGPTTDEAMTRSEEELRVGTRSREAGRARLRKYVVTERQSVTVPVRHEEVRIEREPITDANVDAALGGAAISEEEHEVVLHEEVPVVSKEVHAVERVRLDTATVTTQQEVTEEVRKERIEMETLDATGKTLPGEASDELGKTTKRKR